MKGEELIGERRAEFEILHAAAAGEDEEPIVQAAGGELVEGDVEAPNTAGAAGEDAVDGPERLLADAGVDVDEGERLPAAQVRTASRRSRRVRISSSTSGGRESRASDAAAAGTAVASRIRRFLRGRRGAISSATGRCRRSVGRIWWRSVSEWFSSLCGLRIAGQRGYGGRKWRQMYPPRLRPARAKTLALGALTFRRLTCGDHT